MNKKHHVTPFTKTGVKFFTDRIMADAFDRLGNGGEPHDISIKVGSRWIVVPSYAEAYENLCEFLKTTFEEINGEENEQC